MEWWCRPFASSRRRESAPRAGFPSAERAVVLGAVIAVRVIGDVEVDDVDAGRRRIELHVSAGLIRFRAAGLVGKWHKQTIDIPGFQISERRQSYRLPFQ